MIIIPLALMTYAVFAQSLICLVIGASIGMVIHSRRVKYNAKRAD